MVYFLEKVVDYSIEKYGKDLENVKLIFPNRRAATYVKDYFAKKIDKPIFAPQIFSIEEFISAFSKVDIADSVVLIFKLFHVYKSIVKTNPVKFDEFIQWGKIVLSDFNEVDMYNVDDRQVFTFLEDFAKLDNWSVDSSEAPLHRQRYYEIVKTLYPMYKEFKQLLQSENIAFQGMAYRYALDNYDKLISEDTKGFYNQIIFAGFNALAKSEEIFINKLIKDKKAEILWDADEYYFDDEQQEAGYFLRKYKNSIKNEDFKWVESNFKNTSKKIYIRGVAKQVNQAKIAGSILKNIAETESDLTKVSVVLAEESLLTPLLHSVADNIDNANITMGYSFKYSHSFTLLKSLILAQKNAANFAERLQKKDPQLYYFKDIISIAEHPLIKKFKSIENTVSKENKLDSIFYSKDNFVQKLNIYFDCLFDDKAILQNFVEVCGENWNNEISNVFKTFHLLVDGLYAKYVALIEKKENFDDLIELDFIKELRKIITKLELIWKTFKEDISLDTLLMLFEQMISSASLPFYGDPINGLQIMGLLETRTMDFDKIIFLGVNENTIPAERFQNTFIIYQVRKAFDMPTYYERDAIYAYHFYRLLQRCNEAYIIYNTETDDFGKGEKSRFVTQIIYELSKYNKNIIIDDSIEYMQIKDEDVGSSEFLEICIDKNNDFIKEKLVKLASRGLSPTSLNTYRACSLQFYFKYILSLRKTDELTEVIEDDVFGRVCHTAIEELFKPYINQQISESIIKNIKNNIDLQVKNAFKKEFPHGDIDSGKNLLIYNIALSYIQEYVSHISRISKDKNLVVMFNELKISCDLFTIPFENTELTIKANIAIDRIEKENGRLRVIDFKTGKPIEEIKKPFNDLSEIFKEDKFDFSKSVFFQLLFYDYCLQKADNSELAFDKDGIIDLCVYYLRKQNDSIPMINVNRMLNFDYRSAFKEYLQQICVEIFDTNTIFEKCNNELLCKNCDFKEICNR